MLTYLTAADQHGNTMLAWIETAAIVIEVLAVIIIVFSILGSLARYSWRYTFHRGRRTLSRSEGEFGEVAAAGAGSAGGGGYCAHRRPASNAAKRDGLGAAGVDPHVSDWALVVEIKGALALAEN